MCPIGNNAVFCEGWDSNNGDYGNGDCADTPLANITGYLVVVQDAKIILNPDLKAESISERM
jgi:hypothetical protein